MGLDACRGNRVIEISNPFLRRVTLLVLVPVVLSSFIPAQSPPSVPIVIELGASSVEGSFLKPYKNAWKVVYAFLGKEPFLVGTWTDELAAVEIDGRPLLKRSQMADYAKYNVATTYVNVFDPKNMAPVSMDFKRSDTGEWRIVISTRRW